MKAVATWVEEEFNPSLLAFGSKFVAAGGVKSMWDPATDFGAFLKGAISDENSFTMLSLNYINGYNSTTNQFITSGGHAVLATSFCGTGANNGTLGIVDSLDSSKKYNGSQVLGPTKETFGQIRTSSLNGQLVFIYDQLAPLDENFDGVPSTAQGLVTQAFTVYLQPYTAGNNLPDINGDGVAPKDNVKSGAAATSLSTLALLFISLVGAMLI